MTYESMFVYALALAVLGNGALAWITLDLKQQVRELASLLDTTRSFCMTELARHAATLDTLATKSPTVLAARVDELSEAVERLRKTHQRFAGRWAQEHGHHAPPRTFDGGNGAPLSGDDELDAMLALQTAKPVRPGE